MPAKERRTRSHLVASATILLVSILAASLLATADIEVTDRTTSFAGAEACSECHPDEFDAWAETAHARTLKPTRAATLPKVMVDGGTVPHSPGRTTFLRAGDRVIAETTGPDGLPARYEVTHVVGVRRILMFLTETEPGRLQVLPAMLDVPGGEWFDYSHLIFGAPGADPRVPPRIPPGSPTFWSGMTRFFDARCARCHTSGWEFRPPGEEGDRSSYRAMGVDCESCHGPAAAHVAWWSDEPPDGMTADPILKYRALDRERAVSVCLRCHMEGEVVDHEFSPGDDYFEHFDPTLLDDRERVDASGRALELIYDGLPFLMSRCGAEGKLTCDSCHAPHGSAYRAQLKSHARGNELCAGCHRELAGTPDALRAHSHHDPAGTGAGCIACHMPFRPIERGHGAITDHSIGIPGPEPLGACMACHTGRRGAPGGVPLLTAATVSGRYREWWSGATGQAEWAAAIEAARRGAPDGLAGLRALLEDPAAPRLVRASAARLLAGYPEEALDIAVALVADQDTLVARNAAAALQAMRGDLADAVLHQALLSDSFAVRNRAGRAALAGWDRVRENPSLLEAVLTVLKERTESVPEDDLAWFRLGAARQLAGDVEGAIEAYERELELDPFAHAVRRALAGMR